MEATRRRASSMLELSDAYLSNKDMAPEGLGVVMVAIIYSRYTLVWCVNEMKMRKISIVSFSSYVFKSNNFEYIPLSYSYDTRKDERSWHDSLLQQEHCPSEVTTTSQSAAVEGVIGTVIILISNGILRKSRILEQKVSLTWRFSGGDKAGTI